MVIVITGASSGIGFETAKLLASKGHNVYGLSRRVFTCDEFCSLPCDVSDYARVKECFKEIYDKEGKIDVLINNAGMGISGAAEYTSEEDIKKIFDINVLALINACKEIIPYMRPQGGGKIINVSSVAASVPIPFQAFYSSTKAAVQQFSYALSLEVKSFKIGVSVVCPGDTKTGFTSARIKDRVEADGFYGDRIVRSIEKMEHDEQNGMPASAVSKVIYKIIKKKRSPACKTVGFSYKLIMMLIKILPTKFMLWVVKKLYG